MSSLRQSLSKKGGNNLGKQQPAAIGGVKLKKESYAGPWHMRKATGGSRILSREKRLTKKAVEREAGKSLL